MRRVARFLRALGHALREWAFVIVVLLVVAALVWVVARSLYELLVLLPAGY